VDPGRGLGAELIRFLRGEHRCQQLAQRRAGADAQRDAALTIENEEGALEIAGEPVLLSTA